MTLSNRNLCIFEILLVGFIACYEIALLLISFILIFNNFASDGKPYLDAWFGSYSQVYTLFFAGILGGSFYCIRKLYTRLGKTFTPNNPNSNEALNIHVWFFWYLVRPLMSGVLAVVVLCLFNSGFISFTINDSSQKIFFHVAIGFLVGFGSHEVICKIEEIIQVLFSSSKLKPNNFDGDKSND